MPASCVPDLHGKVALVAGASPGAGRGIAVALGEAGATVKCGQAMKPCDDVFYKYWAGGMTDTLLANWP